MKMLRYMLYLLLIIQLNALRFCVWQNAQIRQKIINKMNSQLANTPANDKHQQIKKLKRGTNSKSPMKEYEKYFNKNQRFTSYHPHYLHSYSYPQPISPQIYFGQLNSSVSYQFLVQNAKAMNQKTKQLFYVNGKQLFISHKKPFQQGFFNLRSQQQHYFAMVIQIQNLLYKPFPTKLFVYNFGKYLGIICQLYENYYKSFIVYISQNGKKVMNMSSVENQFTLKFKNITGFSNQMNWKIAKQQKIVQNTPNISLQTDKSKQMVFQTFVMEIALTPQNFKKYKVIVQQFPKRQFQDEEDQIFDQDQQTTKQSSQVYTSVEQIWRKMEAIKIDGFQYRLFLDQNQLPNTCESKAQNQLLQGLSYQYGNLIIVNQSTPVQNDPKQLMSFSPARGRFPWGFLWDDGFHCQVAVRSHPQLVIKIIKSWLDSQFDFGWIPRQQLRGQERQALCNCPMFMKKDVRDGNPPTLIIPLSYLARQGVLTKQNFDINYWNKIKNWYNWFLQTQTAEKNSYIFRWYDSIPGNYSFNSGMDDFPRLQNSQGHVDCQSWMFLFTKTLSDIALALDFNQQFQYFANEAIKIREKFKQNFIDPETKIPQDYSRINGVKTYNKHFGYPSILSIAVGMLDSSTQQFEKTLQKIKDQLDSGNGLTSLSKKDRMYLQNPSAYWKGPVWININYMFLRGLNLYYPNHIDYYKKLRMDLMRTVCGQQEQKKFFFQNYINGQGHASYPFTGWTTLIVNIVRQNY